MKGLDAMLARRWETLFDRLAVRPVLDEHDGRRAYARPRPGPVPVSHVAAGRREERRRRRRKDARAARKRNRARA